MHARAFATLTAAALAAVTLAACGGDDDSADTSPPATTAAAADTTAAPAGGSAAPDTTAAAGGGPSISDERCAANEAAGTIAYLTNYGLGASGGSMDVIVGAATGAYEAYCLDVSVAAGNSDNPKLVAAGTTPIARLGGPAEFMTAVSGGIDNATAIALYSNVSPWTVVVMDDGTIDGLKDLEGKKVGYYGTFPAEVSAMFAADGVDESKVEQVSVGFDTSILPRGQVDALTAYRSNEPLVLEASGEQVKQFPASDYGVVGASGLIIANNDFIAEHPSAVEDFLRATFATYNYCAANLDECISELEKVNEAGFDAPGQTTRFQVEDADITAFALDGKGLGALDVSTWQPQMDLIVDAGVIPAPVDLDAIVDPSFVDAIYDGTTLIEAAG